MATKKKVVKKATKKSPKTYAQFEMEGAVFLTERNAKTNAVVKKEEIDGEVVLKCLLHIVETGLQYHLTAKELGNSGTTKGK